VKGNPYENNVDDNNSNPPTRIIKFQCEYNKLVYTAYDRTMKEPGLIFRDKDIMEKQNKVIGFLMKKIGTNLLKGKSIMNVSLPVYIFDKRTLLEVYAYELSLAPYFLPRAYYTVDSLEKLKWVTVFFFSQLHLSPLQIKPFTPILGETFQCTIGDLNVYIEQTSSKPITSNFYCFDNKRLYKIYGHITTSASTGANSVKATKVGKYIIEFNDGRRYEYYFPQINIKGTTIGKRLFNIKHSALITDRYSNLCSIMQFNPDEKGFFSSIFSSKQKTYPDTVR
jgi:hypothetical protein